MKVWRNGILEASESRRPETLMGVTLREAVIVPCPPGLPAGGSEARS